MRKISQMEFYLLGEIANLRTLREGLDQNDWLKIVFRADGILDRFIASNAELAPQSVEKAIEVRGLLAEIVRLYNEKGWPDAQATWLLTALTRFETSLEDELARMPTFLAEPVGAYSFGQLIGQAQMVFPAAFRDGVIPNQALIDFNEAGACLAFDLATACGFHAFRATDAMLRKYCDHFGAKLKGNGRDWGKYIRALRAVARDADATKKPNSRVIELIDSIRAIDRNPVVHPEDNLETHEALIAFDLCKNAISLMAMDMTKGLVEPPDEEGPDS